VSFLEVYAYATLHDDLNYEIPNMPFTSLNESAMIGHHVLITKFIALSNPRNPHQSKDRK